MATNEDEGENLEFNVATASDIEVFFTDDSKTSADDTATAKYVDTPCSVRKFQIRNDQTIQILSINNRIYTDPITVTVTNGIIERRETHSITKIAIRVLTANTNLKIRVI